MKDPLRFRHHVMVGLSELNRLLDATEWEVVSTFTATVKESVDPAVLAIGWAHAVRGSLLVNCELVDSVALSLAGAVFAHGDPEAMSEVLDTVLHDSPREKAVHYPPFWTDIASALALMFEPSSSEASIQWLLRCCSQQVVPHAPLSLAAKMLVYTCRYAAGQLAFEAAVSVGDVSMTSFLNRSLNLCDLGHYHDALQVADEGIVRRDRRSPPRQYSSYLPFRVASQFETIKIRAWRALGQYEAVLLAADQWLAHRPEDPHLLCVRVQALHEMALYSDALLAVDRGLALAPGSDELICAKAEVLAAAGRPLEALELAKHLTQSSPSEVKYHLLVLRLSTRLSDKSHLNLGHAPQALRDMYRGIRSTLEDSAYGMVALADGGNEVFTWIDAVHAATPETRLDTATFFDACLRKLLDKTFAGAHSSPGSVIVAQKFASWLVGFVAGASSTCLQLAEVACDYLTLLDEVASSAPYLIEDRVSFLIALHLASLHMLSLVDEAPGIRVQHLEKFVEARNRQRAALPNAIKPTLLAFLDRAAATHMALADQPDALAAAEQCNDLVHRTFELLRALEIRWAAERRRPPAFRKPDGGGATFDSAFEDLGCIRARLSKDQVLVRFHWILNTGFCKPSLVLQIVRPQHPVVTRRCVCDPDLRAKVFRFDGLQLALWTASRSGNDAVRAVLFEHGLYKGKGPSTAPLEILDAWTADVLGHLGQQVFGDVLSVADLRDKHLLLSPPAECMALPWLAVTLPCGTRLLEVVKSLQLVPVVSPAVDAPPPPPPPPPGPSRAGKVIICSPFEGTWYRTDLPQLCRSCDFDPVPWREDKALNPCIESVFDEVARRTIAHLIAHLGWPHPQPCSNGLDCHPLVEMLSHRRLDTERLILELCNSGRPAGLPEGENFQSLAIACLAAGVKEVLATGYPVTPTHQDRATYRTGLYRALSGGHSLAEANVLATRHLWDSPALDPLGRAILSIWSPMLLVTAGVR